MSEAEAKKKPSAQMAYHQRKLDDGQVRLSVYVPTEEKETFWKTVHQLRLRWRKMGYDV